MFVRLIGFWHDRRYHLDQMGLKDLSEAYFHYYAIQVYLVLGTVASVLALIWTENALKVILAAAVSVAMYPLLWYLIHRFLLHSSLYRVAGLAKVWKRVHYDHHRDPNDLKILFGALYTTLPTVALATLPIGYAIAEVSGALAALAAGVFTTCFYEYCHCVQHLGYQPRSAYLKKIKAAHLAHHFYNENGNYGITNLAWDRIFGTYYGASREMPKSPTVFNLGYTKEVADQYPWVAELDAEEPEKDTAQATQPER